MIFKSLLQMSFVTIMLLASCMTTDLFSLIPSNIKTEIELQYLQTRSPSQDFLQQTVPTITESYPFTCQKMLYVAPTGRGNGLSPDSPLGLIQDALNQATSDLCIKLMAGTYYQSATISGKQRILIEPYGNGAVTISGAIEKLTQCSQANPCNYWQDGGVFTGQESRRQLHKYYYESNFDPYNLGSCHNDNRINTISYHTNNKVLFTYVNELEFAKNHIVPDNGEGGYFTPTRVYLVLANNANPNYIGLNISQSKRIFDIQNSQEVVIRANGHQFQLTNTGTRATIMLHNTKNSVVDGLNFLNGNSAVYDLEGENNLIANNHIQFNFNPGWAYKDYKYHQGDGAAGCATAMENVAIAKVSKQNRPGDIVGNKIEGFANGIFVAGSNISIYSNVIHNIYDDAIEIENFTGNPIVNLRIYDNLVYDVKTGISAVPHSPGPTYIYNNIIATTKFILYSTEYDTDPDPKNQGRQLQYGTATKIWPGGQDKPTQNVKFYFNTIFSPGLENDSGYITSPPLNISAAYNLRATGMEFIDNIIFAKNQISYGTGLAADGNNYDCNLFYSETAGKQVVYWFWNVNNSANNALRLPTSPPEWEGNREGQPLFNGDRSTIIRMDLMNNPTNYFHLDNESAARIAQGMKVCKLPADWPDATRFSSRGYVGATIDDLRLIPMLFNMRLFLPLITR